MGGTVQGGILGGFLFFYWYGRSHRLSGWLLFDIVAPPFLVSMAIARWGCVFAGCCFGDPCSESLPWAITYPVEESGIVLHAPRGIPLHPAPVYNSLASLTTVLLLLPFIYRRRFDGHVGCVFLILYGVRKFVLDFIRGDDAVTRMGEGPFTVGQWIALAMIVGGIYYYAKLRRRGRLTSRETLRKRFASESRRRSGARTGGG
jgi:phosphatidylglycerol:prolipoprotein diacylglycerol transferase